MVESRRLYCDSSVGIHGERGPCVWMTLIDEGGSVAGAIEGGCWTLLPSRTPGAAGISVGGA